MIALSNPKTSVLSQKRPSYSGNLNSKMPGDSRNKFLHWGDVLGTAALELGQCCNVLLPYTVSL